MVNSSAERVRNRTNRCFVQPPLPALDFIHLKLGFRFFNLSMWTDENGLRNNYRDPLLSAVLSFHSCPLRFPSNCDTEAQRRKPLYFQALRGSVLARTRKCCFRQCKICFY